MTSCRHVVHLLLPLATAAGACAPAVLALRAPPPPCGKAGLDAGSPKGLVATPTGAGAAGGSSADQHGNPGGVRFKTQSYIRVDQKGTRTESTEISTSGASGFLYLT